MTPQKNKIEEIDYLRGFAILAVISVHTSVNFTEIPYVDLLLIINVIIDVFSHFAVPSFIFISGFVLSHNYNGPFSKKLFYKKRAKSILPQYMIFSIFYIIFDILLSSLNVNVYSVSILKVIFDLLTANSYYHLWFFALIIQFYMFYPYLIEIYNKFVTNNRTLFFMSIIFVLQQFWILSVHFGQVYIDSTIYLNSINHLNLFIDTILSRIFLSHVFYFTLGIYVSQNYKDVKDLILNAKKWALPIILIMTGIISFFLIEGIIKYGGYYKIPYSYFIVPNIIESLYFPLIFLILFNLNHSITKNKISTVILMLGKYSFGIYLIHAFYIDIIVKILYPHFGIYSDQLIFYPVLFTSTILLSYLSVSQIAHLHHSEIIIGIKRPMASNKASDSAEI